MLEEQGPGEVLVHLRLVGSVAFYGWSRILHPGKIIRSTATASEPVLAGMKLFKVP
jgi:hypothetical protein